MCDNGLDFSSRDIIWSLIFSSDNAAAFELCFVAYRMFCMYWQELPPHISLLIVQVSLLSSLLIE